MRKLSSYLFCSLIFYSAYSEAANYTVNSHLDNGPGSLRQAILELNQKGADVGGNTITIFAGLSPIKLSSHLPSIQKEVMIKAEGATPQIINGQGQYRLLRAYADVSLSNCILEQGLAEGDRVLSDFGTEERNWGVGGAIYVDSRHSLSIDNVSLVNNKAIGGSAFFGGGIGNTLSHYIGQVKAESGVGGAVFVADSACFTIQEGCSLTGNSVEKGFVGDLILNEPLEKGYAPDIFLFKDAKVMFDTNTTLEADFKIQSDSDVYCDGGIVKRGLGTVAILSADNNYRGGTQIEEGMISIVRDENLGHAEGSVFLKEGGLKINGSFATGRKFHISNRGVLDIADDEALTISSEISGAGAVEKEGKGTLIFTNSNSYAGGTQVRGGTLKAGRENVLPSRGYVHLIDAKLDLNQFNQDIEGITGERGSIVTSSQPGAVTLKVGGEGEMRFEGTIEDGAGVVTLLKKGSGLLELTEKSSYSGGTFVTEGTLKGNTVSLQGDIQNDAIVAFYQPEEGTYQGKLFGKGKLIKEEEGKLKLTQANTYSGGSVIKGGALEGSTQSIQGDIENQGTLIFSQDFDGVYGGKIWGQGELRKESTGVVTLTGENLCGGGVVIAGGGLKGNTTSLQGDVENQGTLIFDQSETGTYRGVISGTGCLVKRGRGGLNLVGELLCQGGIVIEEGNLEGSTQSLQGEIRNEALLTFAQETDGVYSGNISGKGGVIKKHAGTLTLKGNHTYSGETRIEEGILRMGVSQTLSPTSALYLSATSKLDLNNYHQTVGMLKGDADSVITNSLEGTASLTVAEGENHVFSGTLEDGRGRVRLIKEGNSTLTLKGRNTHTGGTLIQEGTLQGDVSSLTGDIENHGILLFDQVVDGKYEGIVSGSGQLIKHRAGTLTLGRNVLHTGGTIIAEGTIQLGVDHALPTSGEVTLLRDGATLDLCHYDQTLSALRGLRCTRVTNSSKKNALLTIVARKNHTFSGVIEGAISVIKDGDTTFTLNGHNTYTGNTQIARGSLRLGMTNALPVGGEVFLSSEKAVLDLNHFEQTVGMLRGVSGSTVLSRSGGFVVLRVDNAIDHIFQGSIQNGRGILSLVKQGSGTLNLEGKNLYTGGTTIVEGTLELGSAQALPSNTVVTLSCSGARLDLGPFDCTLSGLSGVLGTHVTTYSEESVHLVIENKEDYLFGGHLSDGKGRLSLTKRGYGQLTLSGSNFYSGETTISGGVLKIAEVDAIPKAGKVVLSHAEATLDLHRDQTIAMLEGVQGAIVTSTLADQAITLTIDNEVDHTFDGTIIDKKAGSLSLAKKGKGVLTLTNHHDYSGETKLFEGTLCLGKSDLLPSYRPVHLLREGATLNINGFDQQIAILNGVQGSVVTTSSSQLTTLKIGSEENSLFQGCIQDGQGKLRIIKEGSGTLTLRGSNQYSGGTVIQKGVLEGDTTSLQGDIVNKGTLVFDQFFDGSYQGTITGEGEVRKQAHGVLTLLGHHTYTGESKIIAGTLRAGEVNTFSPFSIVHLSGGAVLDINSHNQSISNLKGDATTLITNNAEGSAELRIGDNTHQHFYGRIQDGKGSLGVIKEGDGVLILGGTNEYKGGTTVLGGVLQGNTRSLQGDITNDATLIFDQAEDGVYSGKLSGFGNVIKQNEGILTLSGDSTEFKGSFFAQAGRINLQGGSVGSSLVIQPFSELKGTGILGSLYSEGTFIPGGSIGTVFISGSYTSTPSSVLSIEINQSQSSLVQVTGTAVLDGTLNIVETPGIYRAGHTYTILTAGAISGSFQNIFATNSTSFFSVQYLLDAVHLQANNDFIVFPQVALNNDQKNVSQYLFCSVFPFENEEVVSAISQLLTLEGESFSTALNRLTPAPFGALPLIELESNYRIGNSFFGALGCERSFENCPQEKSMPPKKGKWRKAKKHQIEETPLSATKIRVTPLVFGTRYRQTHQSAPKFNNILYGGSVVVEHAYSGGFTVGGGLGYSFDQMDWHRSQGDATSNSLYFGPTFRYESARWYSGVVLLGTVNFYDVERKIRFADLNRKATNNHTSWNFVTKGVIGGLFKIKGGVNLQPAASVEYFNSFEPEYQEHHAQSLNLRVRRQYTGYIRSLVGIEAAKQWKVSETCIRPGINLAWLLTAPTTNNRYRASFVRTSLCKDHFTVSSYHSVINQIQVGANICFNFGTSGNLKLAYEGAFGERNWTQEGLISFFYTF